MSKLVWQALRAALLPVRLRDIPAVLDRFLEHLGRTNDNRKRRRAVEVFLNLLGDD